MGSLLFEVSVSLRMFTPLSVFEKFIRVCMMGKLIPKWFEQELCRVEVAEVNNGSELRFSRSGGGIQNHQDGKKKDKPSKMFRLCKGIVHYEFRVK